MKTKVLSVSFVIGTSFIMSPFVVSVYASCVFNEDWSEAPCLDTIANGRYDQSEVNQWANYYQYKGTMFMEQKRSELNQAISGGILQEWVDESIQNKNVYAYYFFSGRAPSIGQDQAEFDKFMIKESSTIHDPYTDDERYQLVSSKVPLGGLGIDLEINQFLIILGVLAGVGVTIGLILFWKKNES